MACSPFKILLERREWVAWLERGGGGVAALAAVAAVAGGSGSGETVFPTDTKHTVGPP